jgi:hypothetical protein
MDKTTAGNLIGTLEDEFYIGKGDITQSGQNIVGLRTNGSGQLEYKESGGSWIPISAGGFDVDTILVDDVTGAVLTDDVTHNVLVNE